MRRHGDVNIEQCLCCAAFLGLETEEGMTQMRCRPAPRVLDSASFLPYA
jgi:hypothetical protein